MNTPVRFSKVLGLAIAFLFSSSILATEGITVVGKGAVDKAPDQFNVNFVIEKRHSTLSKAKADVDNKKRLLISSLKALNVEEQAITDTQLQIMPVYPRRDNNGRVYLKSNVESGSEVITSASINNGDVSEVYFDVKRTVNVNLNDISLYETLLDKAVKIGVTRISPVQSQIKDTEALYQQALELAVKNAKDKATQMAEQLGVSLGRVIKINEHGYRIPAKAMRGNEMMMSNAGDTSHVGLNSVNAEVTVTFSLQ